MGFLSILFRLYYYFPLFFGFSLIAEDKIDQRNFADKMIHFSFQMLQFHYVRKYLSSFTVPKFEFNEN